MCAVCRRPVDRFETFEDPGGAGAEWEWVLTAYCHGRRERVRIPFSALRETPTSAIHFAQAFADEALQLPQAKL